MNTELGNVKDHATSVDSLSSRSGDCPSAVVPQLESGHITVDTQNNCSPEHCEYEERLTSSQQQQEARVESVVPKESLADWGVVVCVFLCNLLLALDVNGVGVFYPFLVEQFDATTAAVGWCSSISGFFQALVALFASYPIKSYGCRLPGVVGSLLFSLGLSFSCLAPNLTTIYFTYGIIAGSGCGLSMLATSIIVHQRFTRNRTLATGIGWVGFSIGGIIASLVTNQLVLLYSWRGAFLILGAIQAQRISLCLFFRTPKRLTSQSTQTLGNKPKRISGQLIWKYLKETLDFSIFRQSRYSVYSVAYFLHVFCLYGYAYHIVNRAVHIGLSRDQGVGAVSLMSSMSTATRFLVSFIANIPKVSSSLVFATGMFFAFLSIVAIFINPGIIGTMTSAVLFGIHNGCTSTVFTIVAVDLVGVALLPRGLAILLFIAGFAKLASTPFIGWIFDMTRGYNKAFAIIGCMSFVSGSLMVVLTFVTRCHRKSVAKDIELHLSDKPSSNPHIAS